MNSTQYYYLDSHNKVTGPLSLDELAKKFVEYEIQATTNICQEGGSWVQARNHPELTKAVSKERAIREFNNNKQNFTTSTSDTSPSKCESDKQRLAKSYIPDIVNGIGIAIYILAIIGFIITMTEDKGPTSPFNTRSEGLTRLDFIIFFSQLLTGLMFQSIAYVLRYIRYKAAK